MGWRAGLLQWRLGPSGYVLLIHIFVIGADRPFLLTANYALTTAENLVAPLRLDADLTLSAALSVTGSLSVNASQLVMLGGYSLTVSGTMHALLLHDQPI